MLPNFILAGTLPAGTGQLYGLLAQHPEVYLAPPMQPECNFFFKTSEYEKGLSYYEERWFSGVVGQKAVGERSSLLLSGERAPDRVARHLPGVKLVFLFRNPADRAYANYRFTALAGYEDLDFEEALACEERRRAEDAASETFRAEIQPHAYFHRGLYDEELARWLARFPAEQLLLMRSDELQKDGERSMAKVFRFLGVDETFRPEPFRDFSSPDVMDRKLQCRLRREHGPAFDAAIQRLREGKSPQTELDRTVRSNVRDSYAPLSPDQRRRLASRYAGSIRRLAPLVPFSVEDWLG
ncbi:MAG: sulfotransferase domain-containing protein [Planctomycetes bacterium]|nr:sulfotransferase domain-containing protein [Planctomycetota bacterium]